MNTFPDSAEQFYTQRDDRTNRCSGVVRAYQNTSCAVRLSPEAARTLPGQVMFVVAANLLSRWCREVTLVLQPVATDPSLGFGTGDLGEIVLSQMRDADPSAHFASRSMLSAPGSPS